MSTTLDTVITDLNNYLADEVTDPIGYLETLQLQLQELAAERCTHEEMKFLIGEGVHKGMRLSDATEAYQAVDELDDETWDSVLDFAVHGLHAMKAISLRKES